MATNTFFKTKSNWLARWATSCWTCYVQYVLDPYLFKINISHVRVGHIVMFIHEDWVYVNDNIYNIPLTSCSEWEMHQTKVVEIKPHVLSSINFFSKTVPIMRQRGKNCGTVWQTTDKNIIRRMHVYFLHSCRLEIHIIYLVFTKKSMHIF